MWEALEKPWQIAFEMGWEAFKHSSIPIGAVIVDENGEIISAGRNRTCEHTEPNPHISHAESEAIQKLDTSKHSKPGYTLYTCMEPCPMCMGTIVMSKIRILKIAAHDCYCGATHYCSDDPYITSKKIQVSFEGGLSEAVQLILQGYWEFRQSNGETQLITKLYSVLNPAAVSLTKELYEKRYLDLCVKNSTPFPYVFNEICSRYNQICT